MCSGTGGRTIRCGRPRPEPNTTTRMFTNEKLTELLCHPRFEKRVLRLLMGAINQRLKEIDPLTSLIPDDLGMIPVHKACSKYGMDMEELMQAIERRHVRGDTDTVNEGDLRKWRYNREPEETHRKSDALALADGDGRRERKPASYDIQKVAGILGLTEERVMEMIMAGSLEPAGDDRVTVRSVRKFEEVLNAAARAKDGQPSPPPPPAPVAATLPQTPLRTATTKPVIVPKAIVPKLVGKLVTVET